MKENAPRLILADIDPATATDSTLPAAVPKALSERFLTSVLEINDLLNSELHLAAALDAILSAAMDLLEAEEGSLLLVDPVSGHLMVGAASHIPKGSWSTIRIPLGSGIAGWVAEKHKPLLIVSGMNADEEHAFLNHRTDVRDGMSVPLERSGSLCGVLNLTNRRAGGEFCRDDLDLLAAFGKQAAIAINQARLQEERAGGYWGMVSSLARAVDARDPYTFGHSQAVRDYAVALAKAAGIAEALLLDFATGALLHDIGKIGVRDAILLKPGRLTDAEFEVVKTHPVLGADILHPVVSDPMVLAAVRNHHERYDGRGYPDRLVGEAIPLTARIMTVADSYDAMSSTRNYRVALRPEEITKEMMANRGRQFDPELVDLFLECFPLDKGAAVMREAARESVAGLLPDSDYDGYASFSLLADGGDSEQPHDLALIAAELIQAQLSVASLYAGPKTLARLSASLASFAEAQGIPVAIDHRGRVTMDAGMTGGAPAVVKALQTYEAYLKTTLIQVTGFNLAERIVRESLATVGERARALHAQIYS